jgi:hypothetical protein
MGGLQGPVKARSYAAGPVPLLLADLLLDLCADCTPPETLATATSSTPLPDLSGSTLPQWSRTLGVGATLTGTQALNRLCDAFGLVWRFLPEQTLWVGPRAYPVDTTSPYVADPGDDGLDRCFVTAPDAATLLPATTLLGRQIVRVVYEVGGSSLRATHYYDVSDRDDFNAAVRAQLPEIPYLGAYMATVVQQRATGLIEVLCDDPRIGVLDRVPLLGGGPAMAVRASPMQRVVVMFAAGSPSQYFALAFGQDVTATQGIARVGDAVAGGTLGVVAPPGGGPCSITYSPPVGPTQTNNTVTMTGQITTGSPDQMLTPATS